MAGAHTYCPENRCRSTDPVTATLKLPRMLDEAVSGGPNLQVEGSNVREALSDLFEKEPGLRSHLVDENGEIRPHVSLFVDGVQAGLDTEVSHQASIRVLHAVSGGSVST